MRTIGMEHHAQHIVKTHLLVCNRNNNIKFLHVTPKSENGMKLKQKNLKDKRTVSKKKNIFYRQASTRLPTPTSLLKIKTRLLFVEHFPFNYNYMRTTTFQHNHRWFLSFLLFCFLSSLVFGSSSSCSPFRNMSLSIYSYYLVSPS